METEEKEIVQGYEIKYSMAVGGKRFVFGVHADEKHEKPYFEGIVTTDELFRRYEGYALGDYFEVMHKLIDSMANELDHMEQMRNAIGMEQISCFKASDLIAVDRSERIVGKVVAINEKYLNHGYRDISHQLYLIDGGFGAEKNSRGNACYGWDLYKRERNRIERYEVIGIVPEEKLPDFARQTLSDIRDGKLKDRYGEDRDER